MKKFIVIIFLLVYMSTLWAQRQEVTIGLNRNHLYDFPKTAKSFESTDHFGISLGWSLEHLEAKELPYRVTIKLERYTGEVNIYNGGLGSGTTLDAIVTKNVIAIGFYPFNFSIKHFLDFNFGVEFNALLLENAKGGYAYWMMGSPPVFSNKPLDDGANKASKSFGVGLNARVAYYIPIQKGWSLVPQYQVFAGLSNEFKNIGTYTRSFRHYLAIGFAKKMAVKDAVSR